MRSTTFVALLASCFALSAFGAPLPELANAGSISTNHVGNSLPTSSDTVLLHSTNDEKSEGSHHDAHEQSVAVGGTKATIARLQRRMLFGKKDDPNEGRFPSPDSIHVPHHYDEEQRKAHITATQDRHEANNLEDLSHESHDNYVAATNTAMQHHDDARQAVLDGDKDGEKESLRLHKEATEAAKKHQSASMGYAKQSAKVRAHGQALIDKHHLDRTSVARQ
ncbi:hypothetical protein FRC14_004912 [Serendipita sp. 396]|nr:hypothetical protein FRC14_004912 [Serendipita sp. 396]KAG8781484.1 hypothetical protein FRC15_008654 [Serendipita sp. 397]KAG8797848.1 hypothetical protein FRC16_008460 [Serendipita sp. 398]KAG8866383.1 hypothetical protein FRC20_008667 [Serendipita sp. 405]